LAIKFSRFFLGCRRIPCSCRTRNSFVARCYGKVDIACQAIGGFGRRKAAPRGALILFSVVQCGRDAPSKIALRSKENCGQGSLATSTQSCILNPHSIRRLTKLPHEETA
jgi:hypothetical protein